MRLHRLRLRSVGPFAGEQTIDFEPLGAGGVFLLDGPTGAGKSTVLDAITFALYGPGEGGGWGRLHSHFAAAGVEPQVQLEFSLRGVRQRVTRSPEYVRPKRRGAGTTREPARVHLERWEHGRWASRSSNKADVGEILGDDLGLTREQFTQVVLLPQGEFMRFLRANDDERRALLTKLFGTQLYDRITDELDRRRVVATRDLDGADKRLRLRIGAAAEAAGLGRDEQDELAGLDTRPRQARLDELGAELAAAQTGASAQATADEVNRQQARVRTDHAEELAARMARFVDASEAWARHERTRPDFERAADVLAAGEGAEPVRPLLESCTDNEVAVADARERLLQRAPDADEQWRRGEGGDELAAHASELNRLVADLSAVVAREQTRPGLEAALQRARAELRGAQADARRVATRQAQLPLELRAVDDALGAARTQSAKLDGLHQRHAAVDARLAAVVALAALEPEREAARERREATFAMYTAAATRHLRLVEARLANMAAELAAALVEGRPCTVCGAHMHPAPARSSPNATTAADVAAAEDLRASAERARDAAARMLAVIDERRAGLRTRAALGEGAADRAALAVEVDGLWCAIKAAEQAAARMEALGRSKSRLEDESAQLVRAQQQLAKRTAVAQAHATTAEQAWSELVREVDEAAAGHPSVTDRHAALRAEARTAAGIAESIEALGGAIRAHHAAVARATREARRTGFRDLREARAAVLPRAQLLELRTRVTTWQAMASAVRGALEAAEFVGLDAADAPRAAADAEAARQAREQAESFAGRSALAADRATKAVQRFAAARADVETARREHDTIDAAAAPVVHLAKLAKGVAGQRRVRLTSYVLRHWFQQVVAAANVRLCGMSSGRYGLVRVDEGSSPAERAGLTLQVLDRHTGEQRNVRSLSGGETFYTSLSLALGLADVVRAEAGGVDLDTLFIDEGFGSLDAETLDQVMGVIDELRDRGRTVGIVSHVSELKERIAERIEVRRLPDGSSTLRVVA